MASKSELREEIRHLKATVAVLKGRANRLQMVAYAREQALQVIHAAIDATWMAGSETKEKLNETIQLIERIRNGVSDAYRMNKNDEGDNG